MAGLTFEWDQEKALTNWDRHRVRFDDAREVFADLQAITIDDLIHGEEDEDRYVTIGQTTRGVLIVVVHTYRSGTIRIISARKANRREKETYHDT